jgi:hypothetical protein
MGAEKSAWVSSGTVDDGVTVRSVSLADVPIELSLQIFLRSLGSS